MIKKIICFIFNHKLVAYHDRDIFGKEYIWQKQYCGRCGKKL
ncbi:hypothetical protein [Clostridium estertheticum]|nr:hypothetical protein [Clostridium estertheticum]